MNADIAWFRGTVAFGAAGLALLLPLWKLWPAPQFRLGRRAVVLGASLFWPAFAFVLVQWAWTGYYQLFYPAWMKWGVALAALVIYPLLAAGAHWIAMRLPGHALLWFCLVTGGLAMGEHVAAWTLVDLPGRVAFLHNTPLWVVMLFAFFEYQVYWAGALWLGWLLLKLAALRAR